MALKPVAARTHSQLDEHLWVVVLAGGEGRRISDFTRGPGGVPVPKQYFRFRDERTLLRTTLDRALRLTAPDRVVCLVLEEHRAWWELETGNLPPGNMLAQPSGRGTAIAILHGLDHIRLCDREARILVMPSDHEVEDEDVLLAALERAARACDELPDDLLLLGIVPSDATDAEYGLVLPRAGDRTGAPRVRAFVEKPPAEVGAELIRRGALWNSFIFACGARTLLRLYGRTAPLLLEAYRRGAAQARDGGGALRRLFARLPEYDFSRDLLQRATSRLRLAAVPECGWTDLGTPPRLTRWLERHRGAQYLSRSRPITTSPA